MDIGIDFPEVGSVVLVQHRSNEATDRSTSNLLLRSLRIGSDDVVRLFGKKLIGLVYLLRLAKRNRDSLSSRRSTDARVEIPSHPQNRCYSQS